LLIEYCWPPARDDRGADDLELVLLTKRQERRQRENAEVRLLVADVGLGAGAGRVVLAVRVGAPAVLRAASAMKRSR
jgi:hypothetical protein